MTLVSHAHFLHHAPTVRMSATKSQEDHITRERRERAKDRQERKISRGRKRTGKREIRVRDRVCVCGSASERVSYCDAGTTRRGGSKGNLILHIGRTLTTPASLRRRLWVEVGACERYCWRIGRPVTVDLALPKTEIQQKSVIKRAISRLSRMSTSSWKTATMFLLRSCLVMETRELRKARTCATRPP